MSRVTVTAIEPCDSYRPGDQWEVSESRAAELEAKGLVKVARPVSNKMRQPLANKRNPSKVAGETQPSSASQAAQASPQTTANESENGVPRGTLSLRRGASSPSTTRTS